MSFSTLAGVVADVVAAAAAVVTEGSVDHLGSGVEVNEGGHQEEDDAQGWKCDGKSLLLENRINRVKPCCHSFR